MGSAGPPSTDRGVAPVLGTILLVAITVVVAATVGLGVLSVSERVGEPPPAVVLDTTTDGNSVTVQHRGGDPVEANRLDVRGAQTWTHRDEQLRAGDELTIEPDPNAESVTVVWDDGQRSAILASAVPQAEDQLLGVSRADTYIPVVPYEDDPTQLQFETLNETALSDPFTENQGESLALQGCLLPISHRPTFGFYSADRNTAAV